MGHPGSPRHPRRDIGVNWVGEKLIPVAWLWLAAIIIGAEIGAWIR